MSVARSLLVIVDQSQHILVHTVEWLFVVYQVCGIAGGGMRSTKHGAQLFNFVPIVMWSVLSRL